MKLAKIYEDLQQQQPNLDKQKQAPPQVEQDPLRSNIDQFWMNPEDMKNDLFKFLDRTQRKDPELARFMRNSIRNILAKFRYEQPKPEPTQAPPSKMIGND